MIRYRFIIRLKRFGLGRGRIALSPKEIERFHDLGVVQLQNQNLKELTENYHQMWNLRLNLTNTQILPDPDTFWSNRLRVLLRLGSWWCMAALSSWFQLSALLR